MEVFGQTRLLKWSIPGLAHFFTMWGFFILLTVYLEAYGVLFVRRLPHPVRRPLGALGFLQDFFAVLCCSALTFAIIRIRNAPSPSSGRRGSTARTPAAPG